LNLVSKRELPICSVRLHFEHDLCLNLGILCVLWVPGAMAAGFWGCLLPWGSFQPSSGPWPMPEIAFENPCLSTRLDSFQPSIHPTWEVPITSYMCLFHFVSVTSTMPGSNLTCDIIDKLDKVLALCEIV
jgi:hypothetical protein